MRAVRPRTCDGECRCSLSVHVRCEFSATEHIQPCAFRWLGKIVIFLFCFVLFFIGAISLANNFPFHFWNGILVRHQRRQPSAYTIYDIRVAGELTAHAHTSRQNTIRFFPASLVTYQHFSTFFFSHLTVERIYVCAAHMATIHLSLIKYGIQRWNRCLDFCSVREIENNEKIKEKTMQSYLVRANLCASETFGWH